MKRTFFVIVSTVALIGCAIGAGYRYYQSLPTKVRDCDAYQYRHDSQGNRYADRLICSNRENEGVIWRSDGRFHADSTHWKSGQVDYNTEDSPDGKSQHIDRTIASDGATTLDITTSGDVQHIAQMIDADGTKRFGVVFKCSDGDCRFESQERMELSPVAKAREEASHLEENRLATAKMLSDHVDMFLGLQGASNEHASIFASGDKLHVGMNFINTEEAAKWVCGLHGWPMSGLDGNEAKYFREIVFDTNYGDLHLPLPVSCDK